jgi:acyl-CoA synthetase (AMP-forming)/AMP-acid ligase II
MSVVDAGRFCDWRAQGWHGDQTVGDALARAVARYPDARLTWISASRPASANAAELASAAARVAGYLQAAGLRPGDVVASLLPNWFEGTATAIATMTAGFPLLPLVHNIGPSDLTAYLARSKARVVFTPTTWRGRDMGQVIDQGRPPSLRGVVTVGDGKPPGEALTHTSWQQVLEHAPSAGDGSLSADSIAALLFTSGTSSTPKGVLHSHNTLLAAVRGCPVDDFEFRPDLSYFIPAPAGHITNLLFLLRALIQGSTAVLMDEWNTERAHETCMRYRPVWGTGTPFFYHRLFEHEERTASVNRWPKVFQTGGRADLIRLGAARGRTGFRIYGSSEIPCATQSGPDVDLASRAETDGAPADGVQIRIVDPDGADVPQGQAGEIVMRGPQMFVSYLDTPHDWSLGPWFRSGDAGRLGADGRLTVTGRLKDIVRRGGENVAAQEVEEIVSVYPGVLDVAVVAVPDLRMGELVCAVVKAQPGMSIDLDELRAHFAESGIARFKWPEALVVSDETWPRTASGKVIKSELLEQIGPRISGDADR